MRLVEHSDVFVENLKTSTLHQIGIHESQLLERNPRMLVLRIPPAGLSGDWANYTGFGAQFDGLSGFAHLDRSPRRRDGRDPGDHVHGRRHRPRRRLRGARRAALPRRDRARAAHRARADRERASTRLGDAFLEVQFGGEPQRTGNRDPEQAPQGIYPCRGEERWLAITARDDTEWDALARTIGRDDLLADARFATTAGRYEHHDELDRAITEWTTAQDLMAAFHALQRAGRHRRAAVRRGDARRPTRTSPPAGGSADLTSRDVGTYPHIGYAFQGVPQAWDRGAPVLGEDNDYVFRKVLQLDDEEYQRYVDAKVIVDDYLDADMNPV